MIEKYEARFKILCDEASKSMSRSNPGEAFLHRKIASLSKELAAVEAERSCLRSERDNFCDDLHREKSMAAQLMERNRNLSRQVDILQSFLDNAMRHESTGLDQIWSSFRIIGMEPDDTKTTARAEFEFVESIGVEKRKEPLNMESPGDVSISSNRSVCVPAEKRIKRMKVRAHFYFERIR